MSFRLRTLAFSTFFISFSAVALNVGELDLNFSNDNDTPGYVLDGTFDRDAWGKAVTVDRENRTYVVTTYETASTPPKYKIKVSRFKDDGTLDSSFGIQGEVILPTDYDFNFTGNVRIMLHDSSTTTGGPLKTYAYVAFSYDTGTNSDSDIAILVLDADSGLVTDFTTFGFDKGNPGTNNDYLADMDIMAYVDNGTWWNFVYIAAEVQRSPTAGQLDTDFGVAKLYFLGGQHNTANPNSFGTNGQKLCWFDQASNSGGTQDKPVAIKILNPGIGESTGTEQVLVGGSAFEGNGAFNDGWNLAFCYFDSTGYLVQQWSTQTTTPSVDSREVLADISVLHDSFENTWELIALSTEPESVGSENQDVVLRKYYAATSAGTTNWYEDTNFGGTTGANGNGRVVLNFIRPLSTESMNDEAVAMIKTSSLAGDLYVAANSSWRVNGLKKSLITVIKLDRNGDFKTDFGYNDLLSGGQTGYIYQTFNPFNDEVTDIAFNNYPTKNHGENVVITGSNRNDGQNATYSLTAHLAGDLIFQAEF